MKFLMIKKVNENRQISCKVQTKDVDWLIYVGEQLHNSISIIYLLFLWCKEAKALVMQKGASRIVQGNVGSSTWKGVFGGIMSPPVLCSKRPLLHLWGKWGFV